MSVQFGIWNQDGQPVDEILFDKAKALLASHGPDGSQSYVQANIAINYQAFHTTKESGRETQPYITQSGAVITWDGRLDNRVDLISEFRDSLGSDVTDVDIVAAAYETWGTSSFGRLVGDWALSVWNSTQRSLILAKDPIGTRHIYYTFEKNQVTWCTVLDPLVLLAGRTFALEEEYIAGWLSFFPATHLTPYVGIHAVSPSSFVHIRPGKHIVSKYWDFDPAKRINYRSDPEYEEHFRSVFRESVRRRLRSDSPVLAELSGGMDSSSIVCVADTIIAAGSAETPRLDTVSYYDDSEPNWNERPYFTKVEEKRGRSGCHIAVSLQESYRFEFDREHFAAAPGSGGRPNEAARQFASCVTSQGNRVLLSGVGGDEVTGGVPTPNPELEDLLARGQFRKLAHQLRVWALNKRKPWFHLFFEAVRGFIPPDVVGVPKHKSPAPWLNPAFVKRNRTALQGYESRLRLFGPLPTLQENISTLVGLQRQLGCAALPFAPPYEKRYPYLDRDLLEFLYAISRTQLVRAGQRRSLTRRALVGIVPSEILDRKRKAFVARGPMRGIGAKWTQLLELTQNMLASELGVVDPRLFTAALRKARAGQKVALVPMLRMLLIENWIRDIRAWNVASDRKPRVSVPVDLFRKFAGRETGLKNKSLISAEKSIQEGGEH